MPLIPFPPNQGVRKGIKIENTQKEDEKRGRNKEKGRERITERARERDGEKIKTRN